VTTLIALSCLACGGDGGTKAANATDANGAVDAVAAADTAKPGQPPKTLYEPPKTYEVSTTLPPEITYKDVLGLKRTVKVAIYRPKGAPIPTPIVLLSHGGSKGKTDALKALPEWATTIASAGYIAVAIAHPVRNDESYEKLCDHLKVYEAIQCALKINWERPHDVSRVLDWLKEQTATEPYKSALDLEQVAIIGHSAGAGGAMMLAGAPRNYLCAQLFGMNQGSVVACKPGDEVSKADSRIKAVVAMSPQGPGADGFIDTSYDAVTLPVLMGTGASDGVAGEPESRLQVFDRLPPTDKQSHHFKIYLDDPAAAHTLFQGNIEACTKLADKARCTEMRSWLFSSVLAFIDHELRGTEAARAWLINGGPSGVGAPTVDWNRK